ncbi:CXXC motif containing zinc binding protein-like [Branchiostoma lanceolatum]|uniref:CXXC motif containing zinc binding protein n=1 Tax=Branchiostoma lanceolatum TaxID=7740 RepID=A0A8J9Z740_BRALA|nr:C1orf123 [Branchiostoma lanceolatum]CAH1248345.1 C1orf123 [Branchiostoma lanceolatum]
MVKIALQLKAVLENITNLRPEGEDFRWYLKLKCLSCGEVSEKWQYVTLQESTPLKGGRGHANLVSKCKLCGRENNLDILQDSIQPYCAENTEEFRTAVVFECRGVEPVDFSPRVGFVAEGANSGMKFDEVELTEGEWMDYDENAQEPVGITELEHRFVKA